MPAPAFRIDDGLEPRHADALRSVLSEGGWEETSAAACRLLWTPRPPPPSAFDVAGARSDRLINHVWGSELLTNRQRLCTVAALAQQRLARTRPQSAPFFPDTYVMPEDASAFRMAAAYAPEAVWLRRSKVRGDGLHVIANIEAVASDPRWMVQRSVDRHRLDRHAYSILLYATIASLDPLQVHLHEHGHVVFDPDDAPRSDRQATHGSPWTLEQYAERIRAVGGDLDALWCSIDDVVAATVAAARDPTLESAAGLKLATAGTFELLEIEIVVDTALRPWLLGMTSWPLPLEGRKPARGKKDSFAIRLLHDTLALVGAIDAQPTGGRRLFPSPRLDRLALLGMPTDADLREAQRCAIDAGLPACRAGDARHFVLDDHLVLFAGRSRELFVLNPTASYVWLRAADGMPPAAIVAELATVFPDATAAVARDVWANAVRWFSQGMLVDGFATPPAPAAAQAPLPRRGWNAGERIYGYLGWRTCVRLPGTEIERLVHPTLTHLEAPGARELDSAIEIVATPRGYDLLTDGVVTARALAAAAVAPAVHRQLLECTYKGLGVWLGMRATLVAGGRACLLLGDTADARTGLSAALSRAGCRVFPREALLVRGDGIVRRDGRSGEPGVTAIVVQEAAIGGEPRTRLEPLARGEALRRLLQEDLDSVSVVSAAGAEALVSWMHSIDCYRLIVAAADEAAALLGGAIGPDRRPPVA